MDRLGSANSSSFSELPDIDSPEAAQNSVQQGGDAASSENDSAWRDELAARLTRYRSRRKPPPPRYPSLRLRFEPQEKTCEPTLFSDDAFPVGTPKIDGQSNRALALNPSTDPVTSHCDGATTNFPPPGATSLSATNSRPAHFGAKIIEFPRSSTHEPPTLLDELAEPVIECPRILEAPAITPAPALGGITIETVQQKEIAKRPGIDFPLQSAPLARRMLAGVLDWLLMAAACLLFAFIFWKITAVRPPRFQILGLTAGIPCLLWAAYQYLMIVYSGGTLGLRLAGLDLACFDGSRPSRRRRRWRVLASFLSAASLGMGYAWLCLDEDALCWHDRITHTYLAAEKRST